MVGDWRLSLSPVIRKYITPGYTHPNSHPHHTYVAHSLQYIGCSDPPYDFGLWGDLIFKLGTHLVARYGIEEMAERWSFEVSNHCYCHCYCWCWCQYPCQWQWQWQCTSVSVTVSVNVNVSVSVSVSVI